eukprot:TRINITY_DN17168_c0_g3_i2.p1 TRINITY_DN17168_c0_g3~~TRINITY_DN17168_c0_g3_i2.p1  ORF type:complete len:406 (-),score=33.98 TRINITY_DN17168_c0_g3_i2:274-1491(-)
MTFHQTQLGSCGVGPDVADLMAGGGFGSGAAEDRMPSLRSEANGAELAITCGAWDTYAGQGFPREDTSWRSGGQTPILAGAQRSRPMYVPCPETARTGSAYQRDYEWLTGEWPGEDFRQGDPDSLPMRVSTAQWYGGHNGDAWQPVRTAWCRELRVWRTPSRGSEGHARGECRPCAHFWRETGCSRGEHCERCHLCPSTALREYRTSLRVNKKASRRPADRQMEWHAEEVAQSGAECLPPADQTAEGHGQNMEVTDPYILPLATKKVELHGDNAERNETEILRSAYQQAPWHREDIERSEPDGLLKGEQQAEAYGEKIGQTVPASGPLSESVAVSLGSSSHASGQCRPCAHFWRVTGCSLGEICSRCHLCPPSALREYRHALRMDKKARRGVTEQRDELVPVLSL